MHLLGAMCELQGHAEFKAIKCQYVAALGVQNARSVPPATRGTQMLQGHPNACELESQNIWRRNFNPHHLVYFLESDAYAPEKRKVYI